MEGLIILLLIIFSSPLNQIKLSENFNFFPIGSCIKDDELKFKKKNILFIIDFNKKTARYLSLKRENNFIDNYLKIFQDRFRINTISKQILSKYKKVQCPKEYNYHHIHQFLNESKDILQKKKLFYNIEKIFLK